MGRKIGEFRDCYNCLPFEIHISEIFGIFGSYTTGHNSALLRDVRDERLSDQSIRLLMLTRIHTSRTHRPHIGALDIYVGSGLRSLLFHQLRFSGILFTQKKSRSW